MPRVFFYGCIDFVGHYLFASERDWAKNEEARTIPFTGADMDGRFCPGKRTGRPWTPTMSPESNALVNTNEQTQGHARLTFERGWTLLGVWDNTVDHRGGSHALFLVEGGPYDLETLGAHVQEVFPTVWKRIGTITVVETRP